ncbi:YecA family protein [Gracilibacillus saliphilus]|uniref:YecA family protein n=1 Tax=Gracilibacillus saliphilus TaxID=543890 RepID=UPI001EE20E46|nr:SEC-C metal-binding domain-containing protein [Gracilibacillus saliphilus]
MKTGRNDPCPCGSGKKYKKCCIDQEIVDFKPKKTKESWTPEKVDKMTTDSIFAKLRELGVDRDEQSFAKEIKAQKSGDELSSKWEASSNVDESNSDIDFIYPAIAVLAKRIAPEHILVSDLNEMMQDGYDLIESQQDEQACDLWWKLWKSIFKWLVPRQVESIEQLDRLTSTGMMQSFFNWVQDFEMLLENTSQYNSRYIEMRYQLATEFRKHFSQSSSLTMMNMGTAAAESLFLIDKMEEANQLFEQLVLEDYEIFDKVWIYIRWGDLYTKWFGNNYFDHERARALYEKALELADDNSKRDVEMRIKDLEEGQ